MRADNDLIKLKRQCVNLLFECPRHTQSRSCPFVRVREAGVIARVDWLKRQTEGDLRRLLARHDQCMSRQAGASA